MVPVIKLNGETITLDTIGAADTIGAKKLSELVEQIARGHFGPDEIILEMTVNGQLVEKDGFDQAGDMDVPDVETLDISTVKNPAQQVGNLLGKMGDYLDQLQGGLGKVADQFRVGSSEEANKHLVHLTEGLGAFVELLNSARLVTRSDLSHLELDGESFADKEEKLLSITTSMEKSQKEKDWITVADLLEYELGPLMNEWKEMIPVIEKEVRKFA